MVSCWYFSVCFQRYTSFALDLLFQFICLFVRFCYCFREEFSFLCQCVRKFLVTWNYQLGESNDFSSSNSNWLAVEYIYKYCPSLLKFFGSNTHSNLLLFISLIYSNLFFFRNWNHILSIGILKWDMLTPRFMLKILWRKFHYISFFIFPFSCFSSTAYGIIRSD